MFRSGIDFFFSRVLRCIKVLTSRRGCYTPFSRLSTSYPYKPHPAWVGSENRESRHSSRYTNFRNLLRQSDIMLQGPFNNNTVLQNRPFVEPTNKSINFFLLITQSIIYNDLAQNPNFKTTSTRCRAREKSVAFY